MDDAEHISFDVEGMVMAGCRFSATGNPADYTSTRGYRTDIEQRSAALASGDPVAGGLQIRAGGPKQALARFEAALETVDPFLVFA
ncbi:MAG: hypothetical protein AAGJ96_08625 [Pseudomonadota bacterium]